MVEFGRGCKSRSRPKSKSQHHQASWTDDIRESDGMAWMLELSRIREFTLIEEGKGLFHQGVDIPTRYLMD